MIFQFADGAGVTSSTDILHNRRKSSVFVLLTSSFTACFIQTHRHPFLCTSLGREAMGVYL